MVSTSLVNVWGEWLTLCLPLGRAHDIRNAYIIPSLSIEAASSDPTTCLSGGLHRAFGGTTCTEFDFLPLCYPAVSVVKDLMSLVKRTWNLKQEMTKWR